jgi:hypothetical protein
VFNQRRAASPIRLTLAEDHDNLIDGAWWPRSSHIAAELPQLVGALDSALGPILDIAVNWTSLERTPDLDALGYKIQLPGDPPAHQRLMTVTGSRRRIVLLVVPYRTTNNLAMVVLRRAAAMAVPVHLVHSAQHETAGRILRCAELQAQFDKQATVNPV